MKTLEAVKQAIRERGLSASPFRIGVAVGEQRLSVLCPYSAGSRGEKLFKQGKQQGAAALRIKP